MSVMFNIIIDAHDMKEAAKISFAMALVSSIVVAVAVLVLPTPFGSMDWLLIAAPVLVLSVVWVVVGLFAAVLYAGTVFVGKMSGVKS